MESVGFKEWAIVCEALGRGEQSLILRKGGIAEGRDGFGFQHQEFFLFPTFFHEQVEKTRLALTSVPTPRENEIEIKYFAKLEFATVVTSWETLVALESFHFWQPEVVRERFEYDGGPGIHLAYVRVFRLEPSWIFPDAPRYGGCRSWVELPEPPASLQMTPILGPDENARRLQKLHAVMATKPITR
ncbi:MAG: DUF1802 family protein [Chthoniobacterales bacterium]